MEIQTPGIVLVEGTTITVASGTTDYPILLSLVELCAG
jgi:hypothetical protein